MKPIWIISVILYFLCFSLIANENEVSIAKIYSLSFSELLDVEVVSAGKKEQKVSEVPASVIILTKEEIALYGYTSVNEIMENIPGLFAVYDRVGKGNFGFRGFWTQEHNSNIIFLVNGINQVTSNTGMNIINSINIPVKAIERIEVIRGPMSVNYGNSAFFGVINIITEDYDIDETSVSSGYNSNNNYNFFAGIKRSDSKISFNTNIYQYEDSIDQPFRTMADSLLNSEGNIVNNLGSIKDFTHFKGRHFDLSVRYDKFYSNISYDDSKQNSIAWINPLHDKFCIVTDNALRFQIGHQKMMNKSLTINSKLEYNDIIRKWDFAFSPNDWGIQYLESNRVSFESNLFYNYMNKLKLDAGLNFSIESGLSNFYDIPDWALPNYHSHTGDDDIITRALYFQAGYDFNNLSLLAGVRADQMLKYKMVSEQGYGTEGGIVYAGEYDNEDVVLVPRLALIYSLSPNNVFKLMYGEAISRPTYFENHDMLIWTQQKMLKPEEIKTIELNYTSIFHDYVTFNISLYKNYLDNLIIRYSGFDDSESSFNYRVNGGKVETEGIEAQLRLALSKYLKTDIAAMYTNSEDIKHPEIDMAYAPELLIYLKNHFYITEKLKANLICNFVDEMYPEYSHAPSDFSDPDSPPVGRIGDKVKSYWNINLSLLYTDFLIEDLDLTAKIYNLFDEDFYYPTTGYSTWSQKGIIGMNRTFSFQVSKKF